MATDRSTAGRQNLIVTAPVTITDADDAVNINVAEVPAGAQIQFISVNVSTAFNDTGTDLLDIGDGGSTTRFKSNLDLSSTGLVNYDGGGYQYTSADTIDAQYDGQNSNASLGTLTIQVGYTINARETEKYEA